MRILSCAAALALFAGCASTKTVTYANPDFAGHQFQKVLVYVKLSDAVTRKEMEDNLVAKLRQDGIAASSAMAIWTADEDVKSREAELTQLGIDSVLIIQLESSGVTAPRVSSSPASPATPVNPINSHGYATTTAYDPMNAGSSRSSSGGTTTSGSPHATFTVGLIDAATKRIAWVDKAKTIGDSGTSFDAVRSSFIETTARDLVAANILVRAPSTAR